MLTMTRALPSWRITAPLSCTSPNTELMGSGSITLSETVEFWRVIACAERLSPTTKIPASRSHRPGARHRRPPEPRLCRRRTARYQRWWPPSTSPRRARVGVVPGLIATVRERGSGSARGGSGGRAGEAKREGVCARTEATDKEHSRADKPDLNQDWLKRATWCTVMMRLGRLGRLA